MTHRVSRLRDHWPMTGTDLLAPYGRNEFCWCSSRLKYKNCHGIRRPPSKPGAPLPPDREDSKFLSPSTSIATAALIDSLPEGTPFTMPPSGPVPTPITFTNWEQQLGDAAGAAQVPLSLEALGGLRLEVLRRIARLPASDERPTDAVFEGVYRLTAETVRTVAQLARQKPRPTVLWNQELDVAQFLGRTLLLADHVLYPDQVFDVLLRGATIRRLKEKAGQQLRNAELLTSGLAIPVPPGVAMAAQGQLALDLTAGDLRNSTLVDWVYRQLIMEGPTAREAIFVRAIDDLAHEAANFWLHGRIVPNSVDDETRTFKTGMLLPYDPDYDYGPWITQVKDSAVSALVQRTNERVVAADMFGSEYVSASLFEARLLRHRGHGKGIRPAQAALLADIPELTQLNSPDLTKLLKNEHAVEDLRHQVRASLATARTDRQNIEAITDLAHQLEAASHKLQRAARTDLAWQAVIPGGVLSASMVIGGIAGGLPGLGAGGLGALATLAPFLGTRLKDRRDAAYLFVAARRVWFPPNRGGFSMPLPGW